MARYRRVEVGTWTDAKFCELSAPEPNAQTLWFYLLCGKRTTIFPGLVIATEAVIADDLKWPLAHDLFSASTSKRTLRDTWSEIATRGMAVADWGAGVVMLPKALLDSTNQPRESARPTSPNALRSWAKAWPDIPECDLKYEYLGRLRSFADALGNAYPDAFGDAFAKAVIESEIRSRSSRRGPARDPDPDPDPLSCLPVSDSVLDPDPSSKTNATSRWAQRQAIWMHMLQQQQELSRRGVKPNTPTLPPQLAGTNERNFLTCEKSLLESGYTEEQVHAKFIHAINVVFTESVREGHQDWFKPALIFNPDRFNRLVDMTLEEAARRKGPGSSRPSLLTLLPPLAEEHEDP